MLTGRSPEGRAPRRRHTGRWLGAVICATALVATACGSDSKSSSSTDAPATTAAGGGATTAAAGGDAMAAAKANVEAALVRPTKIEVTEPVGATIPKGKTIDWIQCSIPACTQLGTALKEATDTLGWKLNTIDGGITPETIANAWAKAAANKHDAVVACGFPRSIFEQSLQQLKAANIPVIDIDVTDPAENGITAVIQGADAYPPLGALQADWVLDQGGDKSNVLRVTTSAFPVVGLSTQGFTDEYKKVCPNCGLETLEAQVTDFGDKLSTQIVAFLQSHPDVNIVSAAVSDMVTGLNSALQAAGLADKVQVQTNDINPALEQDIRNGTPLKALTMMENVNMMWQAADVLARIFTDKPFEDSANATPNKWIVTKDNIGTFAEPYPIVEDYQAQYKALWGM